MSVKMIMRINRDRKVISPIIPQGYDMYPKGTTCTPRGTSCTRLKNSICKAKHPPANAQKSVLIGLPPDIRPSVI